LATNDVEMEDVGAVSNVANADDAEDYSRFIYNSNSSITSREMQRSWSGAYDAEDLILGYEELHAEQVVRDQDLAHEMDKDHPVFVCFIFFFPIFSGCDFYCSLCLQAEWRTYIGICVPDTPSPPMTSTWRWLLSIGIQQL
jgi:hypothetical protein